MRIIAASEESDGIFFIESDIVDVIWQQYPASWLSALYPDM